MSQNIEDFLEVYSARLERSDRLLKRNWGFQLLLVSLSVHSFLVGNTPIQGLAGKYLGFETDTQVLQAIIAGMLTYFVMRFGFLVNNFIHMREACNNLLTRILQNSEQPRDPLHRLFFTDNFFEPFVHSEFRSLRWLIVSLATILLSFNIACIYVHIHLIFDIRVASILNIIVFLALVPFCIAFHRSRVADIDNRARIVSWVIPFLAAFLYLTYVSLWLPSHPVAHNGLPGGIVHHAVGGVAPPSNF